MRRQQGFTLIELMIVVAIIGIIAAYATTSYQDSVKKSRRADAKATLMDLAAQFERCYTANGQYTTTDAVAPLPARTCNLVDVDDALITAGPDYSKSAKGFYVISLDAITATSFSLTATVAPNFDDKKCKKFHLSNLGQQTAEDSTTASAPTCW